MDSDDDMHDANDAESLEDFYSGDTAGDSDDMENGDYEFMDNDSDDSDDFPSRRHLVILIGFQNEYYQNLPNFFWLIAITCSIFVQFLVSIGIT